VKQGVVAAAQRAAVRILPIHAEADRAWRFASWDHFMLPKPFARVRIAYGEPFLVDAGDDGLARGLAATRIAMEAVVTNACREDGATLTG
jgi:lysophospholipid acyltransferase (LPLAT)-like uncharacterized protein